MSSRKYSKELVDGPNQAASRSMLRGVGFSSEDFKKPFVGIASTGAKVTPCNMHINKLSEIVEDSINNSGGKGACLEAAVKMLSQNQKKMTVYQLVKQL